MQDSFQVWDPKQIIRKAKDRHIFLFELYLVFAKDVKDTNGKAKYIYKNKLLVSFFYRGPKGRGEPSVLINFCPMNNWLVWLHWVTAFANYIFTQKLTEMNFICSEQEHSFLILYICEFWHLKILYWQTADMGITEHIEGDECKFAAWTGRTPVVENKMILKVTKIVLSHRGKDNIVSLSL